VRSASVPMVPGSTLAACPESAPAGATACHAQGRAAVVVLASPGVVDGAAENVSVSRANGCWSFGHQF